MEAGFALELLDSLRSSLPEDAFQQLLQRQAEGKAQQYRLQLGDAPLQDRLHQLARLRRDEGYVTVCSLDDDGHSWNLQEAHCSVQRIAEEFPTICDQNFYSSAGPFPTAWWNECIGDSKADTPADFGLRRSRPHEH